MTNMKHLIAAALVLASTFAQANTNCDQPRDDFDGLYCLNKVYLEADKDLNGVYKELVGKLDTAGKAKLKSGQLAWIEDRNSRCSRRETNAFYVNLRCATETTISRVQFLQDRLRECKSSGCLPSKL